MSAPNRQTTTRIKLPGLKFYLIKFALLVALQAAQLGRRIERIKALREKLSRRKLANDEYFRQAFSRCASQLESGMSRNQVIQDSKSRGPHISVFQVQRTKRLMRDMEEIQGNVYQRLRYRMELYEQLRQMINSLPSEPGEDSTGEQIAFV